jgi:threonine synthase
MPGFLRCTACQREYAIDEPVWKCECGSLLDLVFDGTISIRDVQTRGPSMWRYREAIPLVAGSDVVSFGEGFTPLLEVDLNGRSVWIKQDHLFPSGSYKDRGATVLISHIKALGIRRVVEDSSGNAGCAVAAYCARAGIACEIYVPGDTSPGKLAQIERYGAVLHKIPGSREATAAAVLEAAQKIYYASHSWNPFFFHGTKTIAYEVCEQLNWSVPDAVVLPVGNGTLLLGASIGFNELFRQGIIHKIPRLIGVQAEGCAPLWLADQQNQSEPAQVNKLDTLAEGIAIAQPVRGKQIIQAVRDSQGGFITVNEDEIKDAVKRICRMGFYIEPTAGAAIAGLLQYLPSVGKEERIVSVFTGHGLKATEKMLKLS